MRSTGASPAGASRNTAGRVVQKHALHRGKPGGGERENCRSCSAKTRAPPGQVRRGGAGTRAELPARLPRTSTPGSMMPSPRSAAKRTRLPKSRRLRKSDADRRARQFSGRQDGPAHRGHARTRPSAWLSGWQPRPTRHHAAESDSGNTDPAIHSRRLD
jgi:hypothetical protein